MSMRKRRILTTAIMMVLLVVALCTTAGAETAHGSSGNWTAEVADGTNCTGHLGSVSAFLGAHAAATTSVTITGGSETFTQPANVTVNITGGGTHTVVGTGGSLSVSGSNRVEVSGTFASIITTNSCGVNLVEATTITTGDAKIRGNATAYALTIHGGTFSLGDTVGDDDGKFGTVYVDGGATLTDNSSLTLTGTDNYSTLDIRGAGTTVTFDEGGTITSNTNGNGINYESTGTSTVTNYAISAASDGIYMHGTGTLTVKSTGAALSIIGDKETRAIDNSGCGIEQNAGTLNVSNMNITTSAGVKTTNLDPIVKVNGGATLNITDSTITPFGTNANEAVHMSGSVMSTTLTGTEITSYNDAYAVFMYGTHSNSRLTLNDGTTLNTTARAAVQVGNSGTASIGSGDEPTTINAYGEYGVYLIDTSRGGVTTNLNIYNNAIINVNTAADTLDGVVGQYTDANTCCGVYVYGSEAILNMSGGTIDVEANVDGQNNLAYGVSNNSEGRATISGGLIKVDSNVTGAKATTYGVFNTGLSRLTISGGEISLTDNVRGDSSEAYGVFNDDGAGIVNYSGGKIAVQSGSSLNNVSALYGIYIEKGSGLVTMSENTATPTLMTVNHSAGGGTKTTYGVYALDDFTMTGGKMAVTSDGSVIVGLTLAASETGVDVLFTGGTIEVTGAGSCGVRLGQNSGNFSMGVHEQLAVNDTPGAHATATDNSNTGHPYINMINSTGSGGLYAYGGLARIYAGTIEVTADNTANAIYVDGAGNVQVLTNEHIAPVDYITNTTVNVINHCNTAGSAFYAAGTAKWAIRGRGAIFTGYEALHASQTATTDGTTHLDPCTSDSGNHRSLSGGTFITNSTANAGYSIVVDNNTINNYIVGNHYLRDDSERANYNHPSDGLDYVSDAYSFTKLTVTVTDAEWELRHALELDNDDYTNDYNLPINVVLDLADTLGLHGVGPGDGDVDVVAGTHILDLKGKTLTYSGMDADATPEPATAVPSVIEVHTNGILTTVDTGRLDATGENTVYGYIRYNGSPDPTVSTAAVHVTGGTYNNGVLEVPAADPDPAIPAVRGADLYGRGRLEDNTINAALIVDSGDATLNSGVVGSPGDTAFTEVGVLIIDGTLTVNGGEIYGNYNGTGILATGGKTTVCGGGIYGDSDHNNTSYMADKAIHVNGADAQVLVATKYAHEIGNVTVESGRFDLQDGTYEDEDSTIFSLFVNGGSAYVTGGIITNASTVSAGELLVDDGVFNGNLNLTGGSTYFQKKDDTTWGAVNGTLTISADTAHLVVKYGDFNIVTTDQLATNVRLHGGLYSRIVTSYGDNDIDIAGETIGSWYAMNATGAFNQNPGMIPVNHKLVNVSNNELRRTDVKEIGTAGGPKMTIEVVDVAGLLAQPSIKLPCYIDLNGTAGVNEDGYTFRSALGTEELNDITVRRIIVEIACATKTGGVWIIEDATKTLDLNGYYFTNTNDAQEVIDVTTNGNLTITDTYDDPKGAVIEFDLGGNDDDTVLHLRGNGNVTMNKGAVINQANQNAAIVLESGSTGTLTINRGEVSGQNAILTRGSGISANVVITGGTLTATQTAISYNGAGNISISGSATSPTTISSTNTDSNRGDGVNVAGTANLTISGTPMIRSYADTGHSAVNFFSTGDLRISGGTFLMATPGNEGYTVCVNDQQNPGVADVIISGGTFGSLTSDAPGLGIFSAKSISLTGGTYKSIELTGDAATAFNLDTIIGDRTTVTAQSTTTPIVTATAVSGPPQVNGTPPNQGDFIARGTLTPSTTIARTLYTGENLLSSADSIFFTDTRTLTITNEDGAYTSNVTNTWDYQPMFALTTGNTTPTFPSGGGIGGGSAPAPSTPVLETEDHFGYVNGYKDGTFRPEGTLTRAEAAAIFYRLLVDQSVTKTTTFSDVPATHWANTPIQALAERGIITGYPDGSFKPSGTISRAEFCTMASRFFELTRGTISFQDVPEGYWAYDYIASAAGYGWFDTTTTNFRPRAAITRAEAVCIVNAMLGRSADADHVSGNYSNVYSDVTPDHEAYYDIMEASIGHAYTKDDNGLETWTEED